MKSASELSSGRAACAATLSLVYQAQQSDTAALEALVERMNGRVLALVLLRMPAELRARYSPEDIVADVWCEALQSLATFDTERGTPFGAWMSTIVHRRLHDLGCGAAARRAAAVPLGSASTGPSAPSADAAPARAQRNERIGRLVAAVSRLPAEQRTVIACYWLEERPVADIARSMQRTPAAVYALLLRAHRHLRGQLAGLEGSA